MNALFFRHYFTTLAPIVITVMYIERTKMRGNSWPKLSMRRRGLSAQKFISIGLIVPFILLLSPRHPVTSWLRHDTWTYVEA